MSVTTSILRKQLHWHVCIGTKEELAAKHPGQKIHYLGPLGGFLFGMVLGFGGVTFALGILVWIIAIGRLL